MKYRLSVLNIVAVLLIISCVVYSNVDMGELSSGAKNWRLILAMILFALGIGAFLLDLILQKFIANRQKLNTIEAIVVAITATLLFASV